MRDKVYIIGYSMDTIIEAITLASRGDKDIVVLATGNPGSPLDEFGDLLTSASAEMLGIMLPDVEFEMYMNPRHIYIPFDKVAIKNTTNGVIQYPLSKRSFSNEEEWERSVKAFADPAIQEALNTPSLSPSKLVSTMKSVMPQEFVDTFCKALQVTRWRGMQLSHFSMTAFTYEFCFNQLANDNYNEYYMKPKVSYGDICEMLCYRYAVNVFPIALEDVKHYLTSRSIDGEVIIMDNRVDQFLDYVGGRFERSRFWCTDEPIPPELRHSPDGIYFTPLHDCWAATVFGDRAKKFMSEPVNTLYDKILTEIPSTKTNIKLYAQYCDLVSHYGNKRLDLGQRIETMIR